jgi:intracellular sulfur oxidation DsrE/DsrF family protein
MSSYTLSTGRRAALALVARSALAAGAISGAVSFAAAAPTPAPASAILADLKQRLSAAPRRRNFTSVPFVVTSSDDWDHEAAQAILSYENRSLQVWECTDIGAPWLTLMREAMNGQVFSYGNPGFLPVAAVHGSAHLTLFDDTVWERHGLAALSGGKAAKNTFVAPKAGVSPLDDLQDLTGYYGPAGGQIRTLQERGAVFIACHDSIHAIARTLQQRSDANSADTIAADLTNHLIPDTVLVPSVVAFLIELQRAGFTYAKGD